MKNVEFSENHLIYLITEGKATAGNFDKQEKEILSTIELAIEAKVDLIQIREKQISASLVFELASKAVEKAFQTSTKILVNDRADIALAAKADGVHLTSRSIPTAEIRRNFPKGFIIGVSTHTIEEAIAARKNGADFVTFSPVFKTESKVKYGSPQGLEKLREVCGKMGELPLIALGGIDGQNVAEVFEYGATGFASIRFLNDRQNLKRLMLKDVSNNAIKGL